MINSRRLLRLQTVTSIKLTIHSNLLKVAVSRQTHLRYKGIHFSSPAVSGKEQVSHKGDGIKSRTSQTVEKRAGSVAVWTFRLLSVRWNNSECQKERGSKVEPKTQGNAQEDVNTGHTPRYEENNHSTKILEPIAAEKSKPPIDTFYGLPPLLNKESIQWFEKGNQSSRTDSRTNKSFQ